MRVGQSLYAFSAVVGLALGIGGTIGAYHLNELKVGGPVYDRVIQSKDLLADILPPPAFVMEAFLGVTLERDGLETLEKTEAQLSRLKSEYEARIAHWEKSALPQDVKTVLADASDRPARTFWQLVENVYLPAARRHDTTARDAAYQDIREAFAEHRKGIDALVVSATQLSASLEESSRRQAWDATLWQFGSIVFALVVLLLGILSIRRRVIAPLVALTEAMRALAAGRLDADVPATGRRDEIGAMAEALKVFRTSEGERRSLASETEAQRSEADLERERRLSADRARTQELQSFVVDIDRGFAQLSAGDLTARMNDPVAPDFEPIRAKFNGAVETLDRTIGAVAKAVGTIRTGLDEITVASDDLSQRTEQQAASLEQTAAALGEVTAAVNDNAASARHAQEVVARAQKKAEGGGEIVGRAVAAMTDIENSSEQIGRIIGVIDEIAFQTNLLALNAGVEAARAGEAGRGFAVVAQEVRGLAQRSAEAAKEIKDLISTSKAQVVQGVALVTTSGESLSGIVGQVALMNDLVSKMALRAGEQATSLREVSIAADQMDKVTQQNAAMVEQTTAAARSLTAETEQLAKLMSTFRTGDGPLRSPSFSSAPPKTPSRPVPQMRTLGHGGAATASSQDEWQDF